MQLTKTKPTQTGPKPTTVTDGLDRSNLSQQVAAILRREITEGARADGSRLNEVALATELGVSRTPVREALSTLTAQGFLDQIPRRGFFVRPLSPADFVELYKIRAILDPAALEEGGIPSAARIDELERLNADIVAAVGDPDLVIELDDDWHLALVEHCGNSVLLDLIRQFIQRTRRYEQAYMQSAHNVNVATDEHIQILGSLRQGDLASACKALRNNMQSANEPVLKWLEERNDS